MLSDHELAEIARRAMMATAGPWTTVNRPELHSDVIRELYPDAPCWFVKAGRGVTICPINGPALLRPVDLVNADADFIAHAREDIPHLVAEVYALKLRLFEWEIE